MQGLLFYIKHTVILHFISGSYTKEVPAALPGCPYMAGIIMDPHAFLITGDAAAIDGVGEPGAMLLIFLGNGDRYPWQ